MNTKYSFLFFFTLMTCLVQGQEVLKKAEAVSIAMENNFDIKIASNNVDVAKNNASVQNSQYLPSVTGSAGANFSNTGGNVTRIDGAEQEFSNNETKGLNASIGLQYMIFDGFGRSSAYKMLQNQYQISELQARLILETTLLNIFNSYYEVARLSQDVANQKQTLAISRDRLQRARYSADYGQGSQLDILNAEVDYNNDSITYLTNSQLLTNEKRNLNFLLGRDVNIDFIADTTLAYAQGLTLGVLLQNARDNNVTLLEQEKLLENSQYNITNARSNAIPKISLNAGYGWNQNFLGAISFIERSSTVGPNVGATLSWNIFDGGATSVRRQNSEIQLNSQTANLEREQLNIERNLANAWTAYQTALFVKDAQKKIVETAKTNFEKSVDQYKLGQITNIVFRQAQLDLLNAQLELNQAKYFAKNAELFLLQISGDLKNAEF